MCTLAGLSDIIALLHMEKDIDVNSTDKNNSSPLHYACRAGQSSAAACLVGIL